MCARPVASLKPNDFGLFDMLGNAMQWCQEAVSYPGSDVGDAILTDEEPSDRASDPGAQSRVLRGGAWLSRPKLLRSSYRNIDRADKQYDGYGFRVVLTLPDGQ